MKSGKAEWGTAQRVEKEPCKTQHAKHTSKPSVQEGPLHVFPWLGCPGAQASILLHITSTRNEKANIGRHGEPRAVCK